MNPGRWNIIKDILADARDKAAAERAEWLEEACGGDEELLGEVESFLAMEDRLPGFIEEPILALGGRAESSEGESFGDDEVSPAEKEVGRRIGPYRLVRLLAEGGMGAVYFAEREEEFEQRVALKLVRSELASRETLHRFHHERQILARLEHPNIARLLDGGTTEDGAPYFAMELIEGEPIDRYCERQHLTTRQRLQLFLPVCSALALAHQNLVVHRDLKPGNILVDAAGTPKLLDFGIAKLLGPEREAGTPADLLRHSALTPRYASPEQLRGEAISTASDVYSLGVVLHQLLTGSLPRGSDSLRIYEQVTLEGGGEAGRLEPPGASPGGASSQCALAEIRHQLGADLEAILARALSESPRERYPSVEQLAADLRRRLDGLPVSARPSTLAYRAGKFLRRHRLGVANAVAILLLAVAFTAALVRQLHETARSRDQAEQIATFLIELFQTAAPDRPAGDEPTVRDLLEAGRERLETALVTEPAVRATLLLRLGEVYSKLGDYPEARELLTESVDLLRRQHAGAHPDLATALGDLAAVCFESGDAETAEALFRESLTMRRSLGETRDLAKPMNNLATLLMKRSRYEEAEAIYRESLAMRRAVLAELPANDEARRNLAVNLRSLATALIATGKLDDAEPLLRESIELRRLLYGAGSPVVATAELSLGRLEQARGNLQEAEALISRAVETRARELGEDHLHTALARRDLGALKLDRGDASGARELLQKALETLTRVLPKGDPETAETESLLGAALAAGGERAEAERLLRRGLEALERQLGPEAKETRAAGRRLEDFLEARGGWRPSAPRSSSPGRREGGRISGF